MNRANPAGGVDVWCRTFKGPAPESGELVMVRRVTCIRIAGQSSEVAIDDSVDLRAVPGMRLGRGREGEQR